MVRDAVAETPDRTPIGRPSATEDIDAEDAPLILDPDKPMIIAAFGRKGSGKSTFNRRIYNTWPYDKVCIDVNGEAEPGPAAERLTTPLPTRFPEPARGLDGAARRYRNLHYVADPGSATYEDDLDRAIGLALYPKDRRVLVWAGEVGEFTPSPQTTKPHMRKLLMQNRHYRATALFDGPRPMNVNPLILAQADLVAIYHLPNPDDRERVAKTIGYPVNRFHEEHEAMLRRGPYWFLLWDANAHQLYRSEPLPLD
jgi:hypothetical protein